MTNMWLWIIIGATIVGGISAQSLRKISDLKDKIEELEDRVDELETTRDDTMPNDPYGVGIVE
jgi:outer membrane murein-binding lipoprotein Lpp